MQTQYCGQRAKEILAKIYRIVFDAFINQKKKEKERISKTKKPDYNSHFNCSFCKDSL